jgi:ABC-2 type transport system ATP-binding protein
MSTLPAIARVEALAFEYPGVRALDEVSFAIGRGTVTALVGPNGAGKTTLLRCLAGLDAPLAGQVEVAGIDVLEHPREAHRCLGYLSDFFGVYEALTVAQCLAHAASIQGVAEDEVPRAVTRTAARLDLADRTGQTAGTLSRGLRQRLAIGQAIIHGPQLLLLDEPAAGLDPEARHSLAVLLRALQGEGMSLVVSSHILAELDEYSTHMLVLREGRLVEHRALDRAAGTQEAGLRRIRIALASPDSALAEKLRAQPGVTVLESDAMAALISWSGDAGAQALLLRALVESGLAVSGFVELRENLHDSYLKTVSVAGGDPS